MNNLSVKELRDSIKLANDLTNEYNWCGAATIIDGICGRCDYCRLLLGYIPMYSDDMLRIICSRYTDLKALR